MKCLSCLIHPIRKCNACKVQVCDDHYFKIKNKKCHINTQYKNFGGWHEWINLEHYIPGLRS